MKQFHAHLYFQPDQLKRALLWSERAKYCGLFEAVTLYPLPIGPHPTGMVEAQFNEASHFLALEWVSANREDFSALIHEETGEDVKDHTDGIQWLGKPLVLDFDFFDLIQAHPELRIHSKT